MRTAIFATLLLLGCGKSDRVTSQTPATERLGTVATSIPKPPVLPPHPVVEISGGVFYLPTDSDSAYVLRYCCKENLPKGFWTIESGDTTSPYNDIIFAAGGGDSGNGVTIHNFSGDQHVGKGMFNIDTGECVGCDLDIAGDVSAKRSIGGKLNAVPLPPSHEAAVYAELWKICKANHLQYRVFNASNMAIAVAWDVRSSYDQMAHGQIDSWRAANFHQDPTAAAEALTKALSGPPTETVEKPFDTGVVGP